MIAQGEVWWAELTDPTGSGPGFRRPVVVVPLTSNLRWADAPGNVRLTARMTGLPRDSVANVSQILTVDRAILRDRTGRVTHAKLELVMAGLDVVLGRS